MKDKKVTPKTRVEEITFIVHKFGGWKIVNTEVWVIPIPRVSTREEEKKPFLQLDFSTISPTIEDIGEELIRKAFDKGYEEALTNVKKVLQIRECKHG